MTGRYLWASVLTHLPPPVLKVRPLTLRQSETVTLSVLPLLAVCVHLENLQTVKLTVQARPPALSGPFPQLMS